MEDVVSLSLPKPSDHPVSIRDSRKLIGDLFAHRPAVYWIDFSLTITVAYGASILFLLSEWFSVVQACSFVIAAFGLFRLGAFIHEIIHLPKGVMTGFKVTWNLLAGVVILAPSTFYSNHADHHRSSTYGTERDGEYLSFGESPRKAIASMMAQALYLPALIFLRFAVLTPVSIMHPGLREWTLRRASSFGINLRYQASQGDRHGQAWPFLLEILCCLRAWMFVAVVLTGMREWTHLPAIYLLGMASLGLNQFRNLLAHRYGNEGGNMDRLEILGDSVNITSDRFLTGLFFPVGLRFHALHHLFPTLPYYNLAEAHRRLIRALPAGSIYHQSSYPSLGDALKDLFRRVTGHRQRLGMAGVFR